MAELIKKIAENNVIVIPVKTVETTAKQSVEVYDNDNQMNYGNYRVEEEEKIVDGQLAFWSDAKQVEGYAKKQVEKYQLLKTRLTNIKTAMAGAVSVDIN